MPLFVPQRQVELHLAAFYEAIIANLEGFRASVAEGIYSGAFRDDRGHIETLARGARQWGQGIDKADCVNALQVLRPSRDTADTHCPDIALHQSTFEYDIDLAHSLLQHPALQTCAETPLAKKSRSSLAISASSASTVQQSQEVAN